MTNAGGAPGHGIAVETEVLLQRISGMIAGARALPLSSSVKLDNKDEILELLREAIERLPEELRGARWMLKEREEYLGATQRKADELVEAARSEAQRLVQRTEIIKEAQAQARRLVEEAREEASRLRLEAEDYADQKLAQFEIVLERTLKTVASGRQKLAGLPEREEAGVAGGPPEAASPGVGYIPFDQRASTDSAAGTVPPPVAAGKIAGESTYPGAFPQEGRGWTLAGGGSRGGEGRAGAERQAGAAQASGRHQVAGRSGSVGASGVSAPGADKRVFDQDT
jgi:vacuolar-type H+-ATPase subunit H